jgi:hypothetical protein
MKNQNNSRGPTRLCKSITDCKTTGAHLLMTKNTDQSRKTME